MSNSLIGMTSLAARLRAIANGMDPHRPEAREAFGEIKKLADDVQEVIDRANSDIALLEKRGNEIVERLMASIEPRGRA